MAVPVVLRDLDPAGDRAALERLWAAAIGDVWALLPAGLDLLRTGVVAEVGGDPVGVVGVEAGDDGDGGVQLLLVDPAVQRRGIGTRLLQAGIERLTALGVTTVALGSGGHDYLWPGVPDDLPGADGFFMARGWRFAYSPQLDAGVPAGDLAGAGGQGTGRRRRWRAAVPRPARRDHLHPHAGPGRRNHRLCRGRGGRPRDRSGERHGCPGVGAAAGRGDRRLPHRLDRAGVVLPPRGYLPWRRYHMAKRPILPPPPYR
jgi:GNAT superfamily N-acetyltransferase